MSGNIIEGPSIERSIYMSLGEILFFTLKANENNILQIDAYTDEKLSADLLLNRAILLTKWLRQNNLKPGDCVSIKSENRLEYSVVTAATFFSGLTLAPLNPEYTHGELQHVINLSKPKVVFCSPACVETFISQKKNYPFVEKVVLFGNDNRKHAGVIMYEDLIKDAKAGPIDEDFEVTPVNPDENVAAIMCSSGTTGIPKGVMLTHYNFTANFEIQRYMMENFLKNDNINEEEKDITTGLSPFFHSMGFLIMLFSLTGRYILIVHRAFKPAKFLESIPKYGITMLIVPPPVVVFLAKHPMVANYDLSKVRNIRCGASPMSKGIQDEVMERFKLESLSQNYGMTETTMGVLLGLGYPHRSGSVGKVVPTMKCKVLDENGKLLGPHQEGELCFKGPLVMKGYINDPETTAKTIDKDNWIHTGDIGYYDDDGYFFIVDRIKELIKYKGYQVAPAELEALLQKHSAVLDAAVIGIEDERAGELPLAFVVKKPNHKVTERELQDFVASQVSSAKHLRGGVYFINEIPKNSTGKILKRVLREQAKKVKKFRSHM